MKSRRFFRRAQKILVGGVNSPVRAFGAVGGSPIFIHSGKGSRLQDVDGREYVDYCLSWGPLILGHAHPDVLSSARAACSRGSTFGASTREEIDLAQVIQKAFPSMELLRLTSSGTEAVMSAIRVARAYTGRDVIVKFSGCYHGHVDSLLVAAGSGATTLGIPDSAGVPRDLASKTLVLPFNDARAAQKAFERWGDRIAAVILEPIAANMGVVLPLPHFLDGIRKLARQYQAVLIFDEVITGFRLCFGGVQTLCGIRPDLTVLGKIVGGGFPLAAYGGRRDLMEMVAPLGPVYQAGTLSGNPVAVAAGLACLNILKAQRPYSRLNRQTGILADEIRREARRAGEILQVNSVGSMFTVFFAKEPVVDYASAKKADAKKYADFFQGLILEGIYFPPAQWEAAFLSTAHSSRDLDRTLTAFGRVLSKISAVK